MRATDSFRVVNHSGRQQQLPRFQTFVQHNYIGAKDRLALISLHEYHGQGWLTGV